MGTIEQPVVGPQDGHSNGKALVALALGLFAMANVIVFAAIFIIDAEALDRIGAWWMLLPFFGLVAGFAATLIGSISWAVSVAPRMVARSTFSMRKVALSQVSRSRILF